MKEYTIVYDEKNHERKYIRYEAGIPIILSKDIVIDECNKEIERLNNIINELDTFLYDKIEHDKSTWGQVYSKPYQICRDKIKELKGDDKSGES